MTWALITPVYDLCIRKSYVRYLFPRSGQIEIVLPSPFHMRQTFSLFSSHESL